MKQPQKTKIQILSVNHWTRPNYKQTMTTKEWKQVLLEDRFVTCMGRVYELVGKNLGAGVYEVSKRLVHP